MKVSAVSVERATARGKIYVQYGRSGAAALIFAQTLSSTTPNAGACCGKPFDRTSPGVSAVLLRANEPSAVELESVHCRLLVLDYSAL